MKFKFFLFVIFSTQLLYGENTLKPCLCSSNFAEKPSAITWIPNGGRFGDNLVSYSKTLWLSLHYDIPILYKQFKYSDQLMLHEHEQIYTTESYKDFSRIIHLPLSSSYDDLANDINALYIIHWKTVVKIDWFDQDFINALQEKITPRQPLETIIIPENCISIAVHVRNGGSCAIDTQQEKDRWPLRFIPDEFYIAQIERLVEMFDTENIYVHIFTDHINPVFLADKFQQALNNPRITFGYREHNSHDSMVLEDFFSMMKFDCLIRPGSNLSRFAQRLGDNKIVIYPEDYYKTADGKTIINVINIKTRANKTERWKTKKVKIA